MGLNSAFLNNSLLLQLGIVHEPQVGWQGWGPTSTGLTVDLGHMEIHESWTMSVESDSGDQGLRTWTMNMFCSSF